MKAERPYPGVTSDVAPPAFPRLDELLVTLGRQHWLEVVVALEAQVRDGAQLTGPFVEKGEHRNALASLSALRRYIYRAPEAEAGLVWLDCYRIAGILEVLKQTLVRCRDPGLAETILHVRSLQAELEERLVSQAQRRGAI